MNRLIKIVVPLLFFSIGVFGQSLTKARVDKLRRCVGKITIEGSTTSGTGFYISSDGSVLTCWHVIADAITADSLGNLIDKRRIFFELPSGEKREMFIPLQYVRIPVFYKKAILYDYCTLSPAKWVSKKTDFFTLGNFDNIQEGDEIYTAGYPLGIHQQFVSKGILSVKFVDSTIADSVLNLPSHKREAAFLDITINKGNSGGPVIRLGKTPSEDRVIGIADFQLNPLASNAAELNAQLKKVGQDFILDYGKVKVNLSEIFKLFANSIIYSSNGIGGCISINHFLQARL